MTPNVSRRQYGSSTPNVRRARAVRPARTPSRIAVSLSGTLRRRDHAVHRWADAHPNSIGSSSHDPEAVQEVDLFVVLPNVPFHPAFALGWRHVGRKPLPHRVRVDHGVPEHVLHFSALD